ncbi:MAG: TerB N-terminal domain-containing protein [Eubacteriales bacterium]|nr:TerB N-terminal domain-containing protein [Eubacteriales bacterium]
MELSELAAYAREKHTIQEQHKWADFPGFSVLAEPGTGKWAALLMRQWDGDTGEEVQRCDIKCGRQCLAEIRVPWLTLPFRMKGQNWVGVIFDGRTDPEIVFGLFDRAVGMIRQRRAYTVILEDLRGNTKGLYHDTALPQKEQDRGTALPPMRSRKIQETLRLPAPEQEHAPADSAPDSTEAWTRDFFREADRTGRYASTALPHIPQKIRDMMRLYEYQGESLEAKSRNFYRQGRFMEDYEDDASWTGEYRRYFTTYHDLHLPQLRGYFTWRTALRKGQFRPIASSLAYMYIYELLCGIGTSSPEDSLRKMREFEKGFLDSGIGDTFMRRNLHRWMLDYAVIHNVPVETARLYELPAIAERDLQLAVLKAPKDHSDEEIFAALCAFGGKKLPQSPVVADNGKTEKRTAGRQAAEKKEGTCLRHSGDT